MKKICIITVMVIIYFTSIGFAFVIGSTNLRSGYPEFNAFLPVNPMYEDVQEYVREAREYVEKANNDIKEIHDDQDIANQKAENAIKIYNATHGNNNL